MSIYKGSRYRRVEQIQVQASDGLYSLVYVTRDTTVAPPVSTKSYVVQEGDTFESISNKYLGSPELWWVLADLNVDSVFCPDDLAAGVEIVVPSATWAGLQR